MNLFQTILPPALRRFVIALLAFLAPCIAAARINPHKAPLYWSVYEYHFVREQQQVADNYIPESVLSANIDWVDANLKPLGYAIIALDGWGDATRLNENGYQKSHSRHWTHDFRWWSEYLQSKGMTLGVYQDPLWIHVSRTDTATKIRGTNIPVSSLIDTSTASWFTWVQVNNPGAEQYVKGCVYYYAELGVKFLRVDFLSWYETGQDRYLGTVGPARPHEDYVTALRWMREAADSCGMFLSLVMPNLLNGAEVEKEYGHMIRVDEDAGTGQWYRWSDNARGFRRTGWSVYANAMDGLAYWSSISGMDSIILDPDFLRLNTFANYEEKKSVVSACLLAGGPVSVTDQYNTIGADIWLYSNKELLALNHDGFTGKPLSNDPAQTNSQVWTGVMSDSSRIVGLFNRESSAQMRSIDFSTIGITGNGKVRDLWAHADLGTMPSFSASVPAHGCIILKVVKENQDLRGTGSMHVVSLVNGTQISGGIVKGTASVLIRDGTGNPVPNARVTVAFASSFDETDTAFTDGSGLAVVVTSAGKTGSVILHTSVLNVTHDTLDYAADQNVITSSGIRMYLGASFYGWQCTPMSYDNGFWKFDSILLDPGTYQLKFANTADWTDDDWGNATGLSGTAQLTTGGKPNITFTLNRRGLFLISFNPVTLQYAITPSNIKRIHAQIYLGASFSGWTLQPMTFNGNEWVMEHVALNSGNYECKFANTSDWSGDDWGNATGLAGTARLTTGGKPNIAFSIPVNSTCNISFNDVTLAYSIVDTKTPVQVTLKKHWNMISVPAVTEDKLGSVLYSAAETRAYRYNGTGYAEIESLNVGTGYWMKFPRDTAVTIAGVPIVSDTIELKAGWNMIGSISAIVPVTAIQTIPAGLTGPVYFGFDLTGYFNADSIVPGRGYWVKANQDGWIVLTNHESNAQRSQ